LGQPRPVAFFIAAFLFLCAALIVFAKPDDEATPKAQKLSTALSPLDSWKVTGTIPLSKEVVQSLKLDDYLYQDYGLRKEKVSLYIGYYLSNKKVGAAHDPLVCLPGQGWLVTKKGRGHIKLVENEEAPTIAFSSMIVERNGDQEYFLYWFQIHDQAMADTLSQKLVALKNRFTGQGQDNAFVRLSCSMNGRSEEQCHQVLVEFIRDFYPVFLEYVRSGNS